MSTKQFHEIFALVADAINQRRAKNNRPAMALEQEDCERDGTPVMRPTPASNVIGLALSGGGIRSAAFCLGAMQALDVRGLIAKLDYLSTVSGGGYIGTSMTAAMSAGTSGKFPFASELRTEEVAGVEHIRDHSNYLFPQGVLNIFSNIVVYLRGIVANVVLLLPWLLLAAALTIPWNQNGTQTDTAFRLTCYLLLALVISLALWALWRSTRWGRNISDVGVGARLFGIALVTILAVAFVELQPWVLSKMVSHVSDDGSAFARVSSLIKVVAGFGTAVGFLGRFLADALKRLTEKPGFAAFASRIAIKLAMYAAGAAVPLLLWVAYLKLSFWGIQEPLAPGWLITLAGFKPFGNVPYSYGVTAIYGVTFIVLGAISSRLSANANSLHRLYRDRLGKAFLFDPHKRVAPSPWYSSLRKAGAESDVALAGSDLLPLDNMRVSELKTDLAPYHLINAALNIEASKYANRRGRNADFFIFSPLFTGSEATGYVATKLMEEKSIGLTAGTAMAVSGAAASSNMGSSTIKPLVPTLAILNVRLGYWLSNPGKVAGVLNKTWIWKQFDRLYFFKELLGLLSEDSETIYLTDGGHLENLGLYELLRRRCKLIIAIDGEADPDLSFGSLVRLERYARIDFSVRIDLPWAALRDANREASETILKSGGLPPDQAPHGPHCALGTIYYPRKTGETDDTNSTGLLLYIKASLTGDENDYVVDYKRRNPDFPHETTLDQLFTEEQFEAYRALGFHAVNSAFKGVDKVSMNPDPIVWDGPASAVPMEERMRAVLA
jgi:hypothetical protein